VRLFLKESYTGSALGWGDLLTILAPSTSGKFGASVATDGNSLLIGAPNDSTHNTAEGLAYLYRPRTGSGGLIWDREGELRGEVPAANYNFGQAVALTGINMLVSSLKDDELTVDHGAAYVFRAGSYEAWVGNTWLDIDAPGQTGLLDDPDDDGQTNVEEFGFGSGALNPLSRGKFDFVIRSGSAGPLIRWASVNKPAYSTAGLERTFEVGNTPGTVRRPGTYFLLEDGAARYTVDFEGLVIGDPPASQPKQFIRLKFGYPAN
jgi:hypothetical protein